MTHKILHLISSKSIIGKIIDETADEYVCLNPYQMFPGANVGVFIFEQVIPLSKSDSIRIKKDNVVYAIENVHPSIINVYESYHKITMEANEVVINGMKDMDHDESSSILSTTSKKTLN